MNPKVSIIIPAFNSEKFICETVKSAMNQSLENYEIIIGDDNSSDNTAEVCRKLEEEFEVISFFRNKQNLNEGANRNKIIAKTTGEYIFPLDHDNILPDGLIRKLLVKEIEIYKKDKRHHLISPAIMQFFKTEVKGDKDWNYEKNRWIYHRIGYEDVLTCEQFCPAISGHYLYHRSVYEDIGGYIEDLGSLDDLAFGIGAYIKGYKYILLSNTLYYHRIHPGSMWVAEKSMLPVYWKRFFSYFGEYYNEGKLLDFKKNKLCGA